MLGQNFAHNHNANIYFGHTAFRAVQTHLTGSVERGERGEEAEAGGEQQPLQNVAVAFCQLVMLSCLQRARLSAMAYD